jgi:hypothetical protein
MINNVAASENWKTNTGSNKTWLQCVFLVQFLDVAQVVIVVSTFSQIWRYSNS